MVRDLQEDRSGRFGNTRQHSGNVIIGKVSQQVGFHNILQVRIKHFQKVAKPPFLSLQAKLSVGSQRLSIKSAVVVEGHDFHEAYRSRHGGESM